jgi:hypothetical protein
MCLQARYGRRDSRERSVRLRAGLSSLDQRLRPGDGLRCELCLSFCIFPMPSTLSVMTVGCSHKSIGNSSCSYPLPEGSCRLIVLVYIPSPYLHRSHRKGLLIRSAEDVIYTHIITSLVLTYKLTRSTYRHHHRLFPHTTPTWSFLS